MGIGERLKQEREMKNMSLDDIQKQTKIQTRYLEAIEKERFHLMPGSFYVRAFIKEYANIVGLDYNELMDEYEQDLPFEREETTANLSRVKSSRRNKPSTRTPVIFSFLPTFIVVLLIIGLLVFIWLFNQDFFTNDNTSVNEGGSNDSNNAGESVQLPPAEREPQSTEMDNETEDGTDEEVNEEENDTEPFTEVTSAEYANNESRYTVKSNEETFILTLTSESSWMEVYNTENDRLVYETINDQTGPVELDITNETEVYLKFGQPQFLSLDINGVPLELSEKIQPNSIQEAWITLEKISE
mgnify:CR=1 FL=1